MTAERPDPYWAHPTAIVEDGVRAGAGTRIWDGVHIRHGARLGESCIVGEKTYIAYDVAIGSFVKINACVYICAGVTIEDFCMISAHTVFTNDRYPRAGNADLSGLETSEPTEETLQTLVRRGTTIGAGATIGPGLTLGELSMVGMGSVVTRDVAAHQLVVGNPARPAGWVCRCGERLALPAEAPTDDRLSASCERCERAFTLGESGIVETA
ncbi:MAG: N-acetyltransferase [bacterium]|nr:N-acetyltransferase [bacterium]